MSLLRNPRGQSTNTLTVKRFLDNEAFATRRVGSVTYSYLSREWVGLNNYYLKDDNQSSTLHIGFDAGSTIVIRCTIATDAVGPIFGVTGKARVMCEGGSIKWYDDSSTVVHIVTIDGKRHDIGVYSDDGYLKPFYDGVTTANGMTSRTSERDFYPCVLSTDANNGAATGVCLSSATQTYAIKIHEIAGTFLKVASGTSLTPFLHYYSCNRDGSETVPYMFETRDRNITVLAAVAGSATSGVTAAQGLGNHVTYGVQLHDLQEAFNTYYTQLIAVLCNDGGVDRGGSGAEQYHAGWEDPVSVNVNKLKNADTPEVVVVGNDTFNSAFCLPAGALPSGATITYPADKATKDYYDDGDLIRGRQPKWNLWADNVGAFRYVKQVPSGVYGQNYSYQMRINIYKDFFGNNILNNEHPDMLGVFDGYSNRAATWHAPRLEVIGLPVAKTYNAVAYYKELSNMYRDSDVSTNTPDRVYAFNSPESEGTVKAVLGNLPYWTLTASQQTTDMKVYGILVRGSYYESGSYHDIFKMIKRESSPLSADSSSEVKTAYQQTGETTELMVTALTDSARIFADNGIFNMYYTMGMLRANSATITDSNLIDCSRLVPSVRAQSYVYQSYKNLMLIGQKNADGKVMMDNTAYNIYISTHTGDNENINGYDVYFSERSGAHRKGTAFKFALCDDNRTPQVLYSNSDITQPKFFAYMEYIRMADDRSFMLMPAANFGYVDSKNDLPTGAVTNNILDAYIVAQGRRVFRRAGETQYNEVNIVSKASYSDLPNELTVYKTTYESYNGRQDFGRFVYMYIWNQYCQSCTYSGSTQLVRLKIVNNDNEWPTSSDGESTLVYYKNFGDDPEDERYYLWRRILVSGSYQYTKVKATVVHYPNKESFPELGDYYKDESANLIYLNNYTYSGGDLKSRFYSKYVDVTVNSYASKDNFPASGSGSGQYNIFYAQDTGKYYNFGQGSGGHFRYHEDEVVYGYYYGGVFYEDSAHQHQITPEVGKIYKSDGKSYRWLTDHYEQISPWYDKGEVIERRAMFADTVAFDRSVWPTSYELMPTGDGDASYMTRGSSIVINNDNNTKYATALFYDQDVMQRSDDYNPPSKYNDYTDRPNDAPLVHPKTMMVRLYEKSTAPHAWCVKDAYMSDKVENWMFTVGGRIIGSTARTCCYFLLSRNEEEEYLLAHDSPVVVSAMLGLCYKTSDTYESYVDLDSTSINFMGFKLSLYKQSATKPYVMNGNTPEFDSTHNITTIFENQNINFANTDYTIGNYTVRVTSDRYLEGFRMNASGNVKSGIFNDNCYYLQITQDSGTVEAGATFLFKITAQ